MFRALQSKLYQDSNQQLLEIRTSEVTYYSNYFTTYSSLAALCASLIVNTVTQVQAYSYESPLALKAWFWLSCSITICAGIHCTVVASVALVYGLGLTLKGPLGSMIRAIRGMAKASRIVLPTFMLAMFGFGRLYI